jgi:hypothetical protein
VNKAIPIVADNPGSIPKRIPTITARNIITTFSIVTNSIENLIKSDPVIIMLLKSSIPPAIQN